MKKVMCKTLKSSPPPIAFLCIMIYNTIYAIDEVAYRENIL